MNQEEKELLLRDLCARLPYHPILNWKFIDNTSKDEELNELSDLYIWWITKAQDCEVKPYLHPMSSMTEEEKKVVCSMNMISDTELNDRLNHQRMYVQNYTIETFDYFNKHHLDYRGLIPIGLALEAPKDMYN